MIQRSKKVLIIFAFVLVILLHNASALGLSPGRTTIDFAPGLDKEIKFTLLNSEHKDIDLSMFARGELSNIVIIEEPSFSMEEIEETREVSYKVSLPSELAPGLHTAEVVVLELPKESRDGELAIGASVGVATQLYVYVPYPGKYIEAELNIQGNEEKKIFVISMVNRGLENIDGIKAKIVIYDTEENRIKELATNEIDLEAGNREELSVEWNVDVSQGRYIAKAIVNYDNEQKVFEKDFEVGEFILDLKHIFVEDFKLGGIAKFNMIVENKWNELISNAYAEMRIYNKQFNEIANLKSATYDIPAGKQTTIVYYWDTNNALKDLYDANIILYYADKKTQQDLKLDVQDDKIEVIGLGYVISEAAGRGVSNSLIVILLTIIGILVIMNVLWFLVLRKKFLKKK